MEANARLYYRENPFKDIPMADPFHLQYVSEKFGVSRIQDFSPEGDRSGDNLPWNRISQAVLLRDNFQCRVCERSELGAVPGSAGFQKIHFSLEVHHIIPRKDKGSDSFRNLITLCEECHRKTFSNGYSGIPSSGPLDLYYLDREVLVHIPSSLQSPIKGTTGFLSNFHVDFTDLGRKILAPAKGARLLVRFVKTDIGNFRQIGDELAELEDVSDFRTLKVSQVNGQTLKVRFFTDSNDRIVA